MKLTKNTLERIPGPWDNLQNWDFIEIRDDRDLVKMKISNEDETKIMWLSVECLGYRKFGEHDLLLYLPDVLFGVYCTKESAFLDWAAKANPIEGFLKEWQHYIVVSVDSIFEYIGTSPPKALIGLENG